MTTSQGHKIFFIVAVDKKFGIGKNGTLPWRFKKEMAHFKRTTLTTKDPNKQNMVIMGRTTWESIPEAHRPLSDRKNVVLSREQTYDAPGAVVATSLDAALAQADGSVETVFIIGGGRVFSDSINDPRLDGMYITKIHKDFNCDTFFPAIPHTFATVRTLASEEENEIHFDFLLYTK